MHAIAFVNKFLVTADKKTDGKIPKSFPGAIAIAPNYKTKKFLDNNHQQCGEDGIEEYMHFVEHLLERVNPTQTKFGSAKTAETISSCFTTPDEAFASMVLDNKLHVWDAQHEKTRNNKGVKGSQLRMKKKYCTGHSKDECGWAQKGVDCYNILHVQTEKLREEENADRSCQTKFRKQAGKNEESDSNGDGNDSDESDDTHMEVHGAPFANMSKLKQCK